MPSLSSLAERIPVPARRRPRADLPAADGGAWTTGPLQEVDPSRPYRVQHRSLATSRPRRAAVVLLTTAAFALEAAFVVWLLQPSHWPPREGPALPWVLALVMGGSLAAVELLRLVNVASLAAATLLARDPVPVRPDPSLRAAVVTTIVPDREPLDVVVRTLRAALQVRHEGVLDVWLLDEGDDPAVRAACERLGVHHFTRRGVERWNTASGPHRARTKHGNHNAWLDAHGDDYDVFLCLDPDHVPLPELAERMLGWFRDPRTAFVVGPQTYGNTGRFVTRAAESQQFVFHSVVQRAGNGYGAAMLVGTSNAVRVAALRDIGGFHDSITEDAATSLAWHAHRDPATGQRWRSVYTPDVLAVGEGPSSWTDYFTQQHRWARGGVEIALTGILPALRHLRPVHALHYAMLLAFYPVTALAWVLGAVNATTYLVLGVGGLVVPPGLWLAFYVDAVALQLALFFYNRRHNTSPVEEVGSSGLSGMLMTVLCTPVYVLALGQALARRTTRFVVTPKGGALSPDRLRTFGAHLSWASLYAGALVVAVVLGHDHGPMRLWAAVNGLLCLVPVALWGAGLGADALAAARAARAADHDGLATAALATATARPATRPATDLEAA